MDTRNEISQPKQTARTLMNGILTAVMGTALMMAYTTAAFVLLIVRSGRA